MKKNIALLHGWGADREKLKQLKSVLEKRGWNTYLPEIKGLNSTPPKEVWGVVEYADDINREASDYFVGHRFFVFGHSFGGRVAIQLGVTGRKISGIIICAAGGLSRAPYVKRLVFSAAAKAGKILLLFPEAAELFKKLLYKSAREHDYEQAEGIMKLIFQKIVAYNLKPLVPQIHVPVLTLWGSHDRMTPVADGYFVKAKLPRSKLVVIRGVGHRLPYQKPLKLAKEIELWFQTLS